MRGKLFNIIPLHLVVFNNSSQGAGALLFVTSFAGWYILLAILLAIVDFPIQIPVGDLSSVIKGKSAREMRLEK
jgi:hypothetical protein